MSSSKFIPRADHVGSLLRPQTVASARKAYFESQTISAEQLKEAEDAAILDLIAMQQEVGLKVATDGEARRSFCIMTIWGRWTGWILKNVMKVFSLPALSYVLSIR